jgi:hypothetical protein
MSYLAQSYARSISLGLTLVQAPTTVVAQLVNLLAVADLAPFHEIIKIVTVIAKQVMPAPPSPPLPTQQQPARRSRFSCADISAPPDGYFPPSSSEGEDENEDDEEDVEDENKAGDDDSSAHSVPDYEEDAYPTHSTPQRTSSSSTREDSDYVPRRLSHPSNRPAQAPSPMRPATIMSPVIKRSSPVMRKKLRSPQTVIRKRKQSSPQQIIPDALESSLVSPLRSIKTSRYSESCT